MQSKNSKNLVLESHAEYFNEKYKINKKFNLDNTNVNMKKSSPLY